MQFPKTSIIFASKQNIEIRKTMLTPHKYPTGRADFESIINEGFLYVDKTERMYEMIDSRKTARRRTLWRKSILKTTPYPTNTTAAK